MPRDFLAQRVVELMPSGIRKFFDIVSKMEDVITLGIGEPDFTTPQPILEAGIEALRQGETHYTSPAGIYELREAIADLLEEKYQSDLEDLQEKYDAAVEMLIEERVKEKNDYVEKFDTDQNALIGKIEEIYGFNYVP